MSDDTINLVSIITPAYNGEKYVAEMMESVLSQTYVNWELLIVDDGSTDNTLNIIQSFTDKRIRLFTNSINRGAAFSRNYALREAKGRWIAFLDCDDFWHHDKLEKQLKYMRETGYSFTYTKWNVIKNYKKIYQVTGPERITKSKMYDFGWPGTSTVIYDAAVIGRLQGPDLKVRNDYAILLLAIKYADCYLLPEVLATYRKHEGSLSNIPMQQLIFHHFLLFYQGENRGIITSIGLTFRNIFGVLWKKVFYMKVLRKDL